MYNYSVSFSLNSFATRQDYQSAWNAMTALGAIHIDETDWKLKSSLLLNQLYNHLKIALPSGANIVVGTLPDNRQFVCSDIEIQRRLDRYFNQTKFPNLYNALLDSRP